MMSDANAAFSPMVLLFTWPVLGGALAGLILGALGRQGLLWTLIETVVCSAAGYFVFANAMDLMSDPREAYTDWRKIWIVPFLGWELDYNQKSGVLLASPMIGGLIAFCVLALMRRWLRLRYNRVSTVTSGSWD